MPVILALQVLRKAWFIMTSMMEQKKTYIVFFDIDGTLLATGEKKITKSAAAAIRAAQKNGHVMFINTGRCYGFISDEIKNFGFDGFILGCGTQIIYQGNEIFYAPNQKAVSNRIWNLAKQYGLDIVFEEKDYFYLQMNALRNPQSIRHMSHVFDDNYRAICELPETFPFDKFVTWNNEDSKLDQFVKAVSNEFEYIHRSDVFSEFVPRGYSKSTGIEFVLQNLGLKKENTIAIGDSSNDIPMLSYVPHSVAMGNSEPKSLFEQVEFVTKDINEDGIEYALQHYGLI